MENTKNYTEKNEMASEFFNELKESLNEAIEHASGKRELRTASLPRPPKKLSAAEIAALCGKINVSQAVFARYLNVSVKSVQTWEQGIGKPSGVALKLLSVAEKNPQVLLES